MQRRYVSTGNDIVFRVLLASHFDAACHIYEQVCYRYKITDEPLLLGFSHTVNAVRPDATRGRMAWGGEDLEGSCGNEFEVDLLCRR